VENQAPLGTPCAHCGAGRVGYKVAAPPPRPTRPIDPEEQLGVFDRWALAHPGATLEEAFTAGYIEGHRDALRRQLAVAPPVTADVPQLAPEGKPARTIVAALAYFRDHVLAEGPEEIATGEWCSQDETTQLIEQITKTYGVPQHG
jgi:hypothetical protein